MPSDIIWLVHIGYRLNLVKEHIHSETVDQTMYWDSKISYCYFTQTNPIDYFL